MNPGRYNITVYQGTTFQLSPQWLIDNLPVNLTGYSATMQVRKFTSSPTPLVTASTSNGLIAINAAQGQIAISIPAATTATWPADNYMYDLNLTAPDGVTVYKILTGTFVVAASVVQ